MAELCNSNLSYFKREEPTGPQPLGMTAPILLLVCELLVAGQGEGARDHAAELGTSEGSAAEQ